MRREEYLLKPFYDNESMIKSRTENGIENHRKGYGHIRVTDKKGKPIAGAKLRVTQKTHDFKYGTNLFMLDEFESEEKNAEYRRLFKEYFNLAVVPFYWQELEPEEGKPRFEKGSPRVYRRPAPDLCVEYCKESGITPKAHFLSSTLVPDWLHKYSLEEQWKKLDERYRLCAERYAAHIHAWEVTNELWHPEFMHKMYRDPKFMERSFAMAERYFPQNELICNEGEYPFTDTFFYNRDRYYMQIERALLNGARIDTIGFQYHLWCTPETEESLINRQCDPNKIFRVLDTFGAFGRPMQITEMTFPCHDYTSAEAEALQAEFLKNIYTVWFGIPQMEAAIYWNLVDGYAYGAEPGDFSSGENKLAGGLVRFDMTPKPALKVIKQLFTEKWHTEEELVTDEGGYAHFKGFFGDYDVCVGTDEKEHTESFHLEKYVGNDIPSFTVRI